MPSFRLTVLALAVLTLSACAKTETTTSVFSAAKEECVADVAPQRYIVRFNDGRIQSVTAPSDQEFVDGFVAQNLDQIEFAEPDYYVSSKVDLSHFSSSFTDNWGTKRIDADALWSQGVRGHQITVAVIDSGMDVDHPQLAGQVRKNAAEVADNGIDDDGNGFVDDVGGWDFVANRPLQGDYQIHGTHVAGIVAANHNDNVAASGSQVQGIAPAAKVLPLAFLNQNGSGLISDGVRAIRYAVARGARVINASWGGNVCSRSLRDTIAALDPTQVTIVVAAGNSGANIDYAKEYPASLNSAAQITVGATGSHDLMAHYSNYGPGSVHLFAPGSDIVSTIPGGDMGMLSGTSMAAPFVAGSVALLLSAEPSASAGQIRYALYNSAYKNVSYLNASQGRLDLTTALAELRRILSAR